MQRSQLAYCTWEGLFVHDTLHACQSSLYASRFATLSVTRFNAIIVEGTICVVSTVVAVTRSSTH